MIARLAVLNAAVIAAAAAAAWPGAPGPIRMLGAAATLMLPGVAWLGLFRRSVLDAPRLALAVVGVSAIASILFIAVVALTPLAPGPWSVLAVSLALVNAGAALAGAPGPLDRSTRWGLAGSVALVGFLVTALSALHLVPPLEDHDMEVRGTAYGLAAEGKPYFLTNREIELPMAHPILFHVVVAHALAATGEIEATRPSYESAKRAEAARAAGAPFPWRATWQEDYEAFRTRPALAGTRAASALLAALTLGLLFDLGVRLTGRPAAGLLTAVVYALVPETIVRSAYAGYFAPSVFAMTAAALLVAGSARAGWPFAAGALLALIDHKTVVFVAAVVALFAIRALDRPRTPSSWARRLDPRALALGAGFALASLVWWAYGLAVDARSFVQDHLRMHLAHRILMDDIRFGPSSERYAPSIPDLWIDFLRNTGWTLLPVALATAAVWLAAALARVRRDDLRAVLGAWAIATAVAFSITDWRQTKHLMNGLAPLVAAAVCAAWPLLTDDTTRWRRRLAMCAAAALAVALAVNVATDVRLLRDFRSLTIRGASDIDGW